MITEPNPSSQPALSTVFMPREEKHHASAVSEAHPRHRHPLVSPQAESSCSSLLLRSIDCDSPFLSEGPSRSLSGTPPGCYPLLGLDCMAISSVCPTCQQALKKKKKKKQADEEQGRGEEGGYERPGTADRGQALREMGGWDQRPCSMASGFCNSQGVDSSSQGERPCGTASMAVG